MGNENCPLCGSVKFVVMGRPVMNSAAKIIVKTDYEVVQCKNCELYFVSPELNFSKDEWLQLYNSDYFVEITEWLKNKRKNDLQERLDRTASYLNSGEDIHFLEVGCGQGYGLLESAGRGWNTSGLDIFDNRIADARVEGIKFYRGILTDMGLDDNCYDIIYVDSVLEHVPNPMEYMDKIRNLLKPGGVVYIGVPNEDSFQNDIRKLILMLKSKRERSAKLKPLDNPYHIIGFNRISLKYLVSKSRLSKVYLKNFSRKMEFLSFKFASTGFWKGLLVVPIEFGGMILRRDIYFEVILKK